MYAALENYLGEKLATVVAALVYAVMILLTLYFAFEPQAEFNYLAL